MYGWPSFTLSLFPFLFLSLSIYEVGNRREIDSSQDLHSVWFSVCLAVCLHFCLMHFFSLPLPCLSFLSPSMKGKGEKKMNWDSHSLYFSLYLLVCLFVCLSVLLSVCVSVWSYFSPCLFSFSFSLDIWKEEEEINKYELQLAFTMQVFCVSVCLLPCF